MIITAFCTLITFNLWQSIIFVNCHKLFCVVVYILRVRASMQSRHSHTFVCLWYSLAAFSPLIVLYIMFCRELVVKKTIHIHVFITYFIDWQNTVDISIKSLAFCFLSTFVKNIPLCRICELFCHTISLLCPNISLHKILFKC